MIEITAKFVLVEGVKIAIKGLGKKIIDGFSSKNKKAIIEAITAIQFATIRSRNFIDEVGYIKNEDLTKLWHEALNKVIAAEIDERLPEYLYEKAKFWGRPQDWLNNPETLQLVPKLNDLDQTCEMLLIQLRQK